MGCLSLYLFRGLSQRESGGPEMCIRDRYWLWCLWESLSGTSFQCYLCRGTWETSGDIVVMVIHWWHGNPTGMTGTALKYRKPRRIYGTLCWVPVSYTHLDVYKRQVPMFSMLWTAWRTTPPMSAISRNIFWRRCITPVSYTHLSESCPFLFYFLIIASDSYKKWTSQTIYIPRLFDL